MLFAFFTDPYSDDMAANFGAPPARHRSNRDEELERMVKKWITAKSNWI